MYIKSLFKTEESLVPASASSTSTEASVKIVTEAEKKMASQAQEDPLARGVCVSVSVSVSVCVSIYRCISYVFIIYTYRPRGGAQHV